MSQNINCKILLLNDLIEIVEQLKEKNKVIVLSHGIYDIIHPGILKHLDQAKSQGDILIVTVVKDKDVRRGPGRPIFPEAMRLQNAASLSQVDYVCLIDDEIPFECVKLINPNIFAKGQGFREHYPEINEKLLKEEKNLYFGRSDIYQTQGFSFSSSQIINNFLEIYPEETKDFLKTFASKYSFNQITEKIDEVKNMKILLIGDGIIDEYHYCEPMGRSSKAHLVVNKYLSHEVFAGGAFAIANHLAGFCDNVNLVTLLGTQDSREEFVSNNLNPSIKSKFFIRDEASTVIKKRYLLRHNNQKIFEVNFLNDNYIDGELENEVIAYLRTEVPKYDLVLISDFGHGFITKKIYETIKNFNVKLGVNTQTNGANVGYNLITKYKNPFFVCLDEAEVRLASQDRFGNIADTLETISEQLQTEYMITTLGKRGSIGIEKGTKKIRTPIFSSKVIDTVGAGDAFFAYTAPCLASGMPFDLVSFIGNAVGALAVQIVGNKKSVEKSELLEFVHAILK